MATHRNGAKSNTWTNRLRDLLNITNDSNGTGAAAAAPVSHATAAPPPPDPFRLDRPIYHFTPGDEFTTRDAIEGTLIMGRTGAGKSSGPGRALALGFLRVGMGGIVICHSREELTSWLNYAEAAERGNDVVLVTPGNGNRINVLEHAIKTVASPGELPDQVADLLCELGELAEPGRMTYDNNPFFREAVKGTRIKPAVRLLQLAQQPITLDNIKRIIDEAPTSLAEREDPAWQEESFTASLIRSAQQLTKNTPDEAEFKRIRTLWLFRFAREHYETRENVNSTFDACVHTLASDPLRTLFATETTIDLNDVFHGKLFLLCLPVHRHGKAGRCGAVLFRGAFHRTIKNRDLSAGHRPVFIWMDEAHEFITSQDAVFQAAARHGRCATVMLTQCREAMRAAFGAHGHDAAEALTQHLTTKIVCACEGETVDWVANKLVGHHRTWKAGVSQHTGQEGSGTNITPSIDPQITAAELTRLKTGGPRCNGTVEAIVFKSGREWSNRENHLIAKFDQNLKLGK